MLLGSFPGVSYGCCREYLRPVGHRDTRDARDTNLGRTLMRLATHDTRMGDPACYRDFCPECDLQVTIVDGECPECGAYLPDERTD